MAGWDTRLAISDFMPVTITTTGRVIFPLLYEMYPIPTTASYHPR
jgi:hypothetical protein